MGRRLRGAAHRSIEEWEASWPIRTMQVYIASFYLWSAIAKMRVSGWAWLENGGRIQATLMKRSVMWGIDDQIRGRLASIGHCLQHDVDSPDRLLEAAEMTVEPALEEIERVIKREDRDLFPMALDTLDD